MDKQRQTAGTSTGSVDGEAALRQDRGLANNNYPKRARLFSPDGHAGKDIITRVDDIYSERFVRAHARHVPARGMETSVRAGCSAGLFAPGQIRYALPILCVNCVSTCQLP